MARGRKKKIKEEPSIEQQTIDLTAPVTQDEEQLPSAGLGDTIAKITDFLGIKKCEPCEERRKKLNKQFPWLTPQHLDKLKPEDAELLKRVKQTPNAVQNDDVVAIFDLYNKMFSPLRPVKRCQCPGLFRTMIERLSVLLEE